MCGAESSELNRTFKLGGAKCDMSSGIGGGGGTYMGNRSLHSSLTSQPKTIGHFTAYIIKYECASQPDNLVCEVEINSESSPMLTGICLN